MNTQKLTATMPLVAVALFSWLLFVSAAPPAAQSALDFPLAPKTKWTNHLHQEMGEGAHFGPRMSKLANGNSLDVSVITEIVGSDLIDGEKYMRRETRMKGTLWQTEWLRQTANGLLLGKSMDAEAGDEVLIVPPERLLSPTLKAGESWDWKAADASAVTQFKVVGPADVTVPAGSFHTTEISYETTVEIEGGMITTRQTSWFTSGVGYVKQDTETRLGDHLLSHVIFTLEKFEPAPGAQPAGG